MRKLTGHAEPETAIWALRDVSFSLENGRTLGIIGHNGAGKSTLLRLLCGLGRPSAGRTCSKGRINGLLDLGSGFHPDMTGRENVMTGGLLNGLTKREVRGQEHDIIAFAELEEFIDQPVRTYSAGMYLRLAFATAIHFDPEILVIDEVLAVGDMMFQQKCLERLRWFRAQGKSLIVASHVSEQIRSLCDEVLVLEEGQVVMQGDVASGIRCYEDLMIQRTKKRAAQLFSEGAMSNLPMGEGLRHGTQEAAIRSVRLCDRQGKSVHTLRSGDSLTIQIEFSLSQSVPDMALSLGVFTETNVKCFENTILSAGSTFGPLNRRGIFICHLPELPLLSGRYYINVGFYPTDCSYVYDYHWHMYPLEVISENERSFEVSGVISLSPLWSVSSHS